MYYKCTIWGKKWKQRFIKQIEDGREYGSTVLYIHKMTTGNGFHTYKVKLQEHGEQSRNWASKWTQKAIKLFQFRLVGVRQGGL